MAPIVCGFIAFLRILFIAWIDEMSALLQGSFTVMTLDNIVTLAARCWKG